MKILAIEREFGSGGREIGMKVAQEAGIPYYDTNLLIEAAKRYDISIGDLEDYDEKGCGSLIYNLVMAANCLQGEEASEVYKIQSGVKETIRKLGAEGPAVFIGRCATEIFKYHENVVRVYIYSSNVQKKVNRIMQTEHVSEEDARRLMDKKDRCRRNYFHFFTGSDWRDRKNYDLELNTGMLPTGECVRILLDMIQQ
ncbi:hypothetical protein BRYFOR_07240 [Marvinbryantia formatexigens DSM 14469]|uniref:Cytidylate kinase n=1 Tax=Marvinbryantia formatexigens DSM 14469 TaxID=478749 RepID=C6LF38_9FIRM|nr:cytidylate kinase-like family protein [Marvinbryantia formatexigens]EET60777.1 hypothetical protein BRYFOR_07240 [Marvinbryantia formatexigens DSM 14469]UWO26879.1 cytidylate kinase-like family protein [Marvinbryantia formatexigens DSM 14469]SDG32897.1 Cytidylate kinase [Marvinbryantia formatexigens]